MRVGRTAATALRSAPRAPWPLVAVGGLAAGSAALPPLYLLIRAAQGGWPAISERLLNGQTGLLALRSLALAVGVLGLATAIALPLAWLVSRTDLPGRRLWAVVGALPLVFPSYVAALGWVVTLGPRGLARGWLAPLGVEALPGWVYGYSGAWLVLGLYTYPYLYLLLVAAWRDLDPVYEESSRSLGRGPWRTFTGAVLPQLRSPLAAGALLVVLYALSDFGAVSITRFNTLTVGIFNAYTGLFDRAAAATLATVLLLLAVAVIGLQSRLVGRPRPHRSRPARPAAPVALGRWRLPALAAVAGLALITLGVPLAALAAWAGRGTADGAVASVAPPAAAAALVAALAATLAVVSAAALATWRVRHGGPGSVLALRLVRLGYALPGLVVALALVFFATRLWPLLYQSLALLILAYVVRFQPEAVVTARAALEGVAPAFEEAARSLGRRPHEVWRTITLPLVRRGLAVAFGLVFLTAIKELPATLLLRPTGFETLATRIWTYAAEGIYSRAAPPAVALVAVTAVPLYWLVIRPALTARGGSGTRLPPPEG